MLSFLDVFFTLLHLAIIGFNLLGWIWPATRKAHLVCLALTAGSWFILGLWFGIGYCPITDWQWRIKEKLGEHNLPASFVTYYAEKLTGHHFAPAAIDTLTVSAFAAAILLAVYVNFLRKK